MTEHIASATPQSDDPFEGVISFIEHGLRTNGTNASDWRSDMESVLDVLRALRRSAERGAQLDACFLELEELRARVASQGSAQTVITDEMIEAGHEEMAKQGIALDHESPAIQVRLVYQAMHTVAPRVSPLATPPAGMEFPERNDAPLTTGDLEWQRRTYEAHHAGGSNPPLDDLLEPFRDVAERMKDRPWSEVVEVTTRMTPDEVKAMRAMPKFGALVKDDGDNCHVFALDSLTVGDWQRLAAHRVPTSASGDDWETRFADDIERCVADGRTVTLGLEQCYRVVAALRRSTVATGELSDADILRLIREAGPSDGQYRELTRDVGPYDITEPRPFTRDLVKLLRRSATAVGQPVDPESEAANPVWDLVIHTCAQAWPPGKLSWNNSPTELIVDIINERDEAKQDAERFGFLIADPETGRHLLSLLQQKKGNEESLRKMIDRIIASKASATDSTSREKP